MRKAFSLITAIFVIVLMSTVAALVFNLSGKTIKETSTQYRKEQTALLAKSYTEYAILAIQGYDMPTNGCLKTISAKVNYTDIDGAVATGSGGADAGAGYYITIRMRYTGLPAGIACPYSSSYSPLLERQPANQDTTIDIPSVLIDVNVRYRNPDDPRSYSTATRDQVPWINYNRRTLQRL